MATNNAINLSSVGVAYYNGAGTFSAPALNNHGVIVGAAANDISSTAVGATGTVLIGNTGADPSFSGTPTLNNLSVLGTTTLNSLFVSGNSTMNNLDITGTTTATNLDVTGTTTVNSFFASGNTTLNNLDVTGNTTLNNLTVTGTTTGIVIPDGGFTWSDKTTSFTAVAGNGYFVTGTTTATLPAAPNEGDSVVINDDDPLSLLMTVQAVGTQVIRIGNTVSAAAGIAVNTARGDTITLTYRTLGTSWNARGVQGNWTVT